MNIDDLLFKFRNKEYGAYKLRKKYPITLFIALTITLLIVILFLVIPLFIEIKHQLKNDFIIKVEITPADLSLIEDMLEKKQEPPKPKIEKTEPKLENKVEPPAAITDSVTNSNSKNDSVLAKEKEDNKTKDIDPRIYTKAEFNCGSDLYSFRNWFIANFRYPLNVKKTSGKISIQFSLNTNGIIDSVRIIQGINPELDNEAKKLLLKSPKWSPCIIENRKVKMIFNFPIYIIAR